MYEDIRSQLVKILVELQELNGQPIPEISDDTAPIGDLPEFDSLTAAEALIMLSALFELEFEPKVMITSGDGMPATVREITNNLILAMEQGKVENG